MPCFCPTHTSSHCEGKGAGGDATVVSVRTTGCEVANAARCTERAVFFAAIKATPDAAGVLILSGAERKTAPVASLACTATE